MTIDWQDPRPLKSQSGEALATELMDLAPAQRYAVLAGALEALAALEQPDPQDGPERREALLTVYLRGVAAAAIVQDVALNKRDWTSARDFAQRGWQVEFLPPEGLLLGTLLLALQAADRAIAVLPLWQADPRLVPFGHGLNLGMIRHELARATQERMDQVADHADEVNGV